MTIDEAVNKANAEMSQSQCLREYAEGVYKTGLKTVYENKSDMLQTLLWHIKQQQKRIEDLEKERTATELRILNNFIRCMPNTYHQRNTNSSVVRDILLNGTSHAGQGSCIDKCHELGIDPDGYYFERVSVDVKISVS